MKTLRTLARTQPARTSTARAAGWLAAGLMVAVAAFGPGASPSFAANPHGPKSDSGTAGSVASISVAPCFGAEGISGTVAVTVTSSPFVFDVWVTDHVPGGGDWIEIPGSRQTLTAIASSALPFGPLSVAGHRDGVNSFRVETSGGNAKSSSIGRCESEEPSSPPPSEEPSSPPPSEEPSSPPATEQPSNPPAEVVPVSQDQLPQPETSDTPTGEVLGAVSAPRPTPRGTLPPTDTLSTTAAGSAPIPGWRLILVGLAGLIVSLLLLSSDRTARRRS